MLRFLHLVIETAQTLSPHRLQLQFRAMNIITLLIADDQALFREAVRNHLAHAPGILVVGEAKDGHEAVALARAHAPHVVLMDVQMPNLDGIQATREIAASMPTVRVIAFSLYDNRAIVAAMREAGAVDFIVKYEFYETLVPAIRAAAAGARE